MIPSLLASALASAQNLSIFDPASPSAESIRKLAVLVLAITAFIFVVVEGILFYSIFRFRNVVRRGDGATTDDRATTGSGVVELHLHNWLEAHVLRREAEALIQPTGPRSGTEHGERGAPPK